MSEKMAIGMMAVLISLGVSSLIFLVSKKMSRKSELDREKLSSYECGFDVMMSGRTPFSLRFFLLGIIFLVFDMEFILLFSYVESWSSSWSFMSNCFIEILILILSWSLFHEMAEGALDWKS